jgi:hypothetical protein
MWPVKLYLIALLQFPCVALGLPNQGAITSIRVQSPAPTQVEDISNLLNTGEVPNLFDTGECYTL